MGLGFSEIDFSVRSKAVGGYRMRVALAHLLLTNLMCCCSTSQPTTWINRRNAGSSSSVELEMTLLIISHDTAFSPCRHPHLGSPHHKIEEYRGNYTSFKKIRAERDAQRQAAGAPGKEVARVQTFVDRSLPSEQSQPGPIAHQAA